MVEKERQLIHDCPEYFFEEYLGIHLWDKEKEIIESIRDNRKTTIRSCHGSGKTFTVASGALWFLAAFQPSIVVDTAPTHRQVANQFWREFRRAHKRAKINLGGELLKTQYNIDEDWYAIGVSTKETTGEDTADKFQGFHGENILFIVDEASGVLDAIMEAIDGAMSGGLTVRLVYTGNPTRRTGRFADSFTDSGFKKIHINAFETPNFTANGILSAKDLTEEKVKKAKIIIPGLVTPEWAWEMLKKYTEDSDVWRVRVLGDPPQKESDTVISIDLVERAIDADRTREGEEEIIGVDPARFGDDFTAFVYRKGNYAKVLEKIHGQDTMAVAGRAKNWLKTFSNAKMHIDIIGMGTGVFDRLREQPEVANRVCGVNTALPANDKERYKNLRAEGWDDLAKEWLKTGVLEKHEDWYQLAKPRYKIISTGQMLIESKEDMKKRKISSTDVGDAFVLTLLPPSEGGILEVAWV